MIARRLPRVVLQALPLPLSVFPKLHDRPYPSLTPFLPRMHQDPHSLSHYARSSPACGNVAPQLHSNCLLSCVTLQILFIFSSKTLLDFHDAHDA